MSAKTAKDRAKRKNRRRYLAVFAFDFTIVNQNTDTTVRDLLPEENLRGRLADLVDIVGWTKYMNCVFRELYRHKITPMEIRAAVRQIPEVPGVIRVLKRLHTSNQFDLIIISDSNAVFIREWLRVHDLSDRFVKIFTNPAHFDAKGLLSVRAYHRQTNCKLSARNLCKKLVLDNFMASRHLNHRHRYKRIFYVGSGNYDVCPVLRLRSTDIAFARERYGLENTLRKRAEKNKLRARIDTWKDGFDLLEKFEAIIVEKQKLS